MLRLQVTVRDDPQGRVFSYEFDSDRQQILVGRRWGVDVLLPDPKVSMLHARIERRSASDYDIHDEGSKNGTAVNGVKLTGPARPLHDGDRLQIGQYLWKVQITATKTEWRPEASSSLARRMAQEVLERLQPAEAQPALHVVDGPQAGVLLRLDDVGRTYVLGRAHGELRLDDVDASRERAALSRNADGVTIRELEPGGALTLNGERPSGARALVDGDQLVFGGTRLRYEDPAEVYLKKLMQAPEPESASPLPAARRERRPELWLAGAGVVVALAALAALAWVIGW